MESLQNKNFYPMKIADTWNNLPANAAEAPTIGSFKRRLTKYRRSLDSGNRISEDTDTGIEDEGEGRTEERTEICAGTRLMATHAYTKNQESPIGKEIDLQQWDTLIFKRGHTENENWSLVQDRTGQVGYVPAGFLVVILDTTTEEQESDTTKKGQENSTEENRSLRLSSA